MSGASRVPVCPRARASQAFESYGAAILGYLRRMLTDPDDAETLAQDTFCRLVQADGPFPTHASLRAWLFRVARNLAFDFTKKSRPRPLSSLDERDAESSRSMMRSNFAEALERDEDTAAMHAALATLSEAYRSTITLRFLQAWTYEEIAALEGVSESALRTRVHKGLALMRDALTQRHLASRADASADRFGFDS